MSKQKSQWEFGELFAPEQTRKVLTVGEVTAQIRRLLEQHVGTVWVTGEITNFRQQTSGHIYFSLKDAWAQLSCVLFKGEMVNDRAALKDGQKVTLRGEITVYEARGQYQLRVTAVEVQGVGALQIAFEKLKQKLQAEGLFAQQRKRPLPKYPQRIGLVTSPSGAAIRDVLHVIERRNPSLEIVFVPSAVQGAGAAFELAAAIRLLNEYVATGRGKLDLILVTRGGGSLEDLWAFNEEPLARAIFHSAVPVVSAVGHEIDFTISDFVADVRAATPSAAAEIITEGVFSSCRFVSETARWLHQKTRQRLERERRGVQGWQARLARAHPRRKLNERRQFIDELLLSLGRCARHDWSQLQRQAEQLQARLGRVRPAVLLKQRREILHQTEERLREMVHHRWRSLQERQTALLAQLRLLSPEHVLNRGYSITRDAATGKVIRQADDVSDGQVVRTKLAQGEIDSVVKKERT